MKTANLKRVMSLLAVVLVVSMLLAMVGCGKYASVQAAADGLVEVADVVQPDPELTARYEKKYQQFQRIYPACRELFAQMA